MTDKRWSAVDAYLSATIVGKDSGLEAARIANAAAGLPSIDVSAPQGKLLYLLARMSGHARRWRSARSAAIRRSASPAPCRRTVD